MQSGVNTEVTPTMKPGREGHEAKKGRNAKILKVQSQIISTRNTDGQRAKAAEPPAGNTGTRDWGKGQRHRREGERLGKDRKPKGDKKRSWISNPTY